jgi:hypothetical protein
MPVTNPTAGDIHVKQPLTNFSQKYLQDTNDYVSLRAFPNNPVAKESDLYYEFSKADFFRDQARERADGTESAGGSFRTATNPYMCRVYAIHKDITDRQRTNADSQIQLERTASQFVAQQLMIRRERKFADTFMTGSAWTTNNTSATWGADNSEPIDEIDAAKSSVKLLTGMMPNKAIIARDLFNRLKNHPDVLSRIDGGATTSVPALVMRQKLAELLELDQLLIMDAVYNSKAEVAANQNDATMTYMAAGDMLLYYAPNTPSLDTPTAGQQFSWTGLLGNTPEGMRTKRFRMEHLSSDRIEGEMAFDYKVTAPDLGYYFTDAIAAS